MKITHTPYKRFKGWLRGNDLTYADISNIIGVSVVTVSAKVNGTSDFTVAEIELLIKKYKSKGLNYNIFFTDIVA